MQEVPRARSEGCDDTLIEMDTPHNHNIQATGQKGNTSMWMAVIQDAQRSPQWPYLGTPGKHSSMVFECFLSACSMRLNQKPPG